MSTQKTSYSDFFSSGFQSCSPSDCVPSQVSPVHLHSRSRSVTASVAFPSSSSPLPEHSRHRKRNSIMEFSSKLFDKLKDEKLIERKKNSSEARSFEKLADTRRRLRGLANPSSVSSVSDVYLTADEPYTGSRFSSIHIYGEESNTVPDPFHPSRNSKSVFVGLADPPSPSVKSRPSSFIRSKTDSLISSFTNWTMPPSPRAVSVQSGQSVHCSKDKYDIALELMMDMNEEDDSLSPPSSEYFDPADTDWRQFHIQLLDDV